MFHYLMVPKDVLFGYHTLSLCMGTQACALLVACSCDLAHPREVRLKASWKVPKGLLKP